MDKKITVSVFDKEDLSKTLIENYLKDIETIEKVDKYNDFMTEQPDLTAIELQIVIVDISDRSREILDKVSEISANNKNFKFIMISYDLSTNLIVDSLRSGAKDFLPKPLIKKDLINAIEKICSQAENDKLRNKLAKMVTVYSNKGGLGKTTLAVNLAKEMADISKEKVLLVDLNMHLGDVTAFLDINPNYDIKYFVENIHKIDKDFIFSTFKQYKSNDFCIMADSPFREPNSDITIPDMMNLLDVLKEYFSYIIVDTNSNIDERNKALFNKSDLVFFMTAANLPTLRNCARSINAFKDINNFESKMKIVLNRYIESEGLSISDIEEALQSQVFWKIPNNYFVTIDAINKGMTISEINPKSNIAENFKTLAKTIINKI